MSEDSFKYDWMIGFVVPEKRSDCLPFFGSEEMTCLWNICLICALVDAGADDSADFLV